MKPLDVEEVVARRMHGDRTAARTSCVGYRYVLSLSTNRTGISRCEFSARLFFRKKARGTWLTAEPKGKQTDSPVPSRRTEFIVTIVAGKEKNEALLLQEVSGWHQPNLPPAFLRD